jgi:hypothetical protein
LACSLTTAQERTALDAFDQLLPVIQHPRCANCHGGVNPYVDPRAGRHVGGSMTDPATGEPLPASSCQDCHGELPGWDVPGEAMFFVGRNARDLCIQFKQFAPAGADFVAHIEHEPGSPQFIKTAFDGHRALNTLGAVTYEDLMGRAPTPEPPPGTLQQLVAQARDWVNAIGAGWTEAPDCGCEVSGAWYGTIKATGVFENAGLPGTMRVTSSATVVLERVETPTWSSGRRVQTYRATGGTARWDALLTGQCRGNAGGSMPLDTLDVDGNPMAELRLEDVGNGAVSYQPTTGSWPERWSPTFNVQCNFSGSVITLQTTNLLPTWWHYNIPDYPTSTDPDRLKGTYRWAPGRGIEVIWEWDLTRTR